MQRSDERGLVLEPALDAFHRLLEPQARGVGAGGVEAGRHLVLALDRFDKAPVVRRVAVHRVPARRVHAERLVAHILEDAFVDESRVPEERQLQPVLLVGAQETQGVAAREAGVDAVHVGLELADEGAIVGHVERRPELLYDTAATVLEHAVEARGALVAVGEVVRDHRDALKLELLRGVVAERVHRLGCGSVHVDNVDALLLLGEIVLRGGSRRDQRCFRLQHVLVDGERLEGGERPDDHVDLLALDELLRFRLRESGLPGRVGKKDVDLASGEGVVALLQEQVDAFLHLPAARRERPGAHREEAHAQVVALGEEIARSEERDAGERYERQMMPNRETHDSSRA